MQRSHRASEASTGSPSPDLFGRAVSFRVRRLEPMLAWAITGCTLWVNAALNKEGATAWWLVLMAATMGVWSKLFPARDQTVLLARGAMFTAGALLLHLAHNSGSATGPYFFWPVVVAGFYSFLLSTGWAVVLALLTLLEFGLACWLSPPAASWQQILAMLGVLTTMVTLAILFARAFHASDSQTESPLRDERTQLYNETGFFVHGAVLLGECRKNKRPLSMVLLNGKDLRDLPELIGRKAANDLFAQAVQAISTIQRDGIAARIDSDEFALLLPGVAGDRAAAMMKQRLGNPPQLDITLKGKPLIIVMDMAVAQAKEKDQSIEELYDELHARWARKMQAQRAAAQKPVLDSEEGRFGPNKKQVSSTVPMELQPMAQRRPGHTPQNTK